MGDVLDMVAFRQARRKERRMRVDLDPDEQRRIAAQAWIDGGRAASKDRRKLDVYIDELVELSATGRHQWASFRLSFLQLVGEAPGAAREAMQLAYPTMNPAQFEIWLDRAAEEFADKGILNDE